MNKSRFAVFRGGAVQVQPDLTHLAFEVDSLEEFGKHLAKHGMKYSDGPTTTSTGTTSPSLTRRKVMKSN